MSILTRNLGKIMIILMLVIPNTVLMASGDGAQITKLEKGLMFWSLVTFFIVFLILSKVAWKPLIEGLEQRENTIRGNIEDAESKQKEAAFRELVSQYKKRLYWHIRKIVLNHDDTDETAPQGNGGQPH